MLHEIFEKIVSLYPDRDAVQFEDEKPLTYRELDDLSNQLAHRLLEEGVQPRQYVILYLPRSEWQIEVYLALLKIGAICVPVSSEQLQPRIEKICDDCRPTHIITTSSLYDPLDTKIKHSTKRLLLDKEIEYKVKPKTKPTLKEVNEEDIAYVAYSSGTTGLPKGIPIRHSGMTSYWFKELPTHIKHRVTKVAANVSLDFDAHVWEYLMGWLFGATLHITNEDTRKDVDRLAVFIIKHKISDITLTPAILRTFRDEHLEAFRLNGLQAIYSTGEACTPDIIDRFTKYSVKIFNCYGPTEATFGLSMILCQLKDFYKGMAPIGIPPIESGIHIKIIDDSGIEVKEGEAGELVIISPYLTPGYLNREKENAKFSTIKTSLGHVTSYRTGDRFVINNKRLFYVGRIHSLAHIKIRGQFVDIEGIEQLLREHPCKSIRDAYVVVRNDLGKEPILVAFIISEQQPTLKELRSYCNNLLPSSSIPNFFINIPREELPLTINGKIDREALAKKYFLFVRDKSTPYCNPIIPLQMELIKIWRDVLALPPQLKITIGAKDSFALLGGDSIKAMTLIGEIKSRFNLNLLPSRLGALEELTVEKLANFMYMELTLQKSEESIQLLKDGSKKIAPLFLLPPISGESTFTYQKLSSLLKTPRRVFAINAPALINPLLIGSSTYVIAESYLSLIRKVQPKGALNLIGWSSGGIIAFEIASYLEEKDEVVDFLGIIDEISPQLQHLSSPKEYAKELLGLISFFQGKHYFKFDLNLEDLSELSKEEQTKKAFANLPKNLPISNMLEHVKYFLLNFLRYEPKKLNKTAITIFRTEATHHKVTHLTKVHDETVSLGWNKYSTLYTAICELQGDHFSIMQSPQELAMKLDFCVRFAAANNNNSKEELEILRDLSKRIEKLEHLEEKLDNLKFLAEKFEEKNRPLKKSIVSSPMIWNKAENKPRKEEELSEHPEVLIRAKL